MKSEFSERRGMFRMKSRLLLLVSAFLLLAGCSSMSIESKKIDYKSAGKLPPLVGLFWKHASGG